MLSLIESFLKAEILDGIAGGRRGRRAARSGAQSAAQQHLSEPSGPPVAQAGYEMMRYADDFVILCRTAEDAQRALELVQQWTSDNGLTLHPRKRRSWTREPKDLSFWAIAS